MNYFFCCNSQQQIYSFDPWGRRRNHDTWTFSDVPTQYLFDRGFTGHEHLDELGLINMNGRMYDARLGRFLSPDNFVQAPDDSQNLNRYSYALNNPLAFTDPSGNYNFKVNQPTQQELLSGYISMFATAAIGYFFPPLVSSQV